MTKSGFDLDEIERLRERLGSVSSAMMEGDNLAILLCGYFDNPDQDGSDDDCGWTPDALTGYTQVCDAIHAHYAPTLTAMIAEIRELRAENARLRKLTCATWFYMPDEGDRCWFSPHEVIDEMYDPEPGNHVFEVECATSLPSIWCAVRVTDDPDADERFTFTEHPTEAEARAALGEPQ